MMQHTRAEFIARWQHELAGLMIDAATSGRSGADLGLWVRTVMRTIDSKLGQMYDGLAPSEPKPEPVANGKPVQPAVRK